MLFYLNLLLTTESPLPLQTKLLINLTYPKIITKKIVCVLDKKRGKPPIKEKQCNSTFKYELTSNQQRGLWILCWVCGSHCAGPLTGGLDLSDVTRIPRNNMVNILSRVVFIPPLVSIEFTYRQNSPSNACKNSQLTKF